MKNNPEKRKLHNDRYNTNPEYKKKRKVYADKYSQINKEKISNYANSYNKSQREQVLNHYKCICRCCGENRIEFLAIDHVEGGGRKHRESIKISIYRWLMKNNYPSGFQVLCHNCNSAKSYYGYCPHSILKENHENQSHQNTL